MIGRFQANHTAWSTIDWPTNRAVPLQKPRLLNNSNNKWGKTEVLDPDNAVLMAELDTLLKITRETGYVNGRASRLPWMAALLAIRDMPIQEQDNMLSANMRKIAAEALDPAAE